MGFRALSRLLDMATRAAEQTVARHASTLAAACGVAQEPAAGDSMGFSVVIILL